ncbi:MAG: histidine kinase, partial [Flavobacteriales bacterium]|nr:histidine kinase [Flavobacteriales bacterium]
DIYPIDSSTYLFVGRNDLGLLRIDDRTELNNLDYTVKASGLSNYSLVVGKRCKAIAWSPKDSLIYYSSNFGVFYKEWSSPKTEALLWQDEAFSGNDLRYHKDQLLCGTEEKGVLFFENNQFVAQLSEVDGLKSNTVKKLLVNNDLLYVLTSAGMQVYDLKEKQFLGLGVAEGMIGDGVTAFALSNDKLWLLEKHSFYGIEIADIRQEKEVGELYVDSLVVNGSMVDYSTVGEYSYQENAFTFYFDYRDIESKYETSIQYKLEGFYDTWKTISTSEHKIDFQSLPAGRYTFKVKAVYRNQASEIFTYAFQISPPYWHRWWFYLLLLISVAIVLTGVFRFWLISQRKKATLINELNSSKLTAIQSQMNPHFIFNALNSIQHLVLKGDVDNSYAFINKFASLVRKTLDFSDKDTIRLTDEIKLIQVYLELEKLRFKDNFEFSIILPENGEVNVPPMLIQPFIENALVHGLLHKKGIKRLTVTFKLDLVLTCTIEDNGVGRIKAREIKERQQGHHESFSLTAIKRRFEILGNYYDSELGYHYEDLTPTEANDVATRVVLRIPIHSIRKE